MPPSRLSRQRKNDLRALAKLMNTQNRHPVPVTDALLDCFDAVITPEENAFLLKLATTPHTYDEAAALSALTRDAFAPFFEGLLRRGLVWAEHSTGDVEHFSIAPILVGWFEVYLSDGAETPEKREFARRFDRFIASMGTLNFFPLRNLLNYQFRRKSRPITRIVTTGQPAETVHVDVRQTLNPPAIQVHPAHSVFELIERYGSRNLVALVHCFCRQWRKMVDQPCRFDLPSEACIVIGDLTRHVVNYGIGRYISKERALELVREVQQRGAIHQVFHQREDLALPEMAVCNCCWDCCGVFGSYSRGLFPLRFKSYYRAQIVDASRCTACGLCVQYCPVEAISLVNGTPQIADGKCIGCGQCELQCSTRAIALRGNEREVVLPLQKRSQARIPA